MPSMNPTPPPPAWQIKQPVLLRHKSLVAFLSEHAPDIFGEVCFQQEGCMGCGLAACPHPILIVD